MTDAPTPTRSARIWLIPAVLVAIAGGIWLWFLTQPRVCILIYPAPPGCATTIPDWLPWIGIGLVAVLLLIAVVAALRAASTRVMVSLVIAMVVVIAVFVTIMYLAQAGVFDLPQPPV